MNVQEAILIAQLIGVPMSVSSVSQDDLSRLDMVLFRRPAGRNIVGFASEEIIRLQTKIQQLQNEIARLNREARPTEPTQLEPHSSFQD
jgi:hypothetical protein